MLQMVYQCKGLIAVFLTQHHQLHSYLNAWFKLSTYLEYLKIRCRWTIHHSPLHSITNFKVSTVSRPAPRSKNKFHDFAAVMEKYFEMDHAELVPVADLLKPPKDVFYLPMHTVRKEHSTTTKIRAVFDTSAKSSTGVSPECKITGGHRSISVHLSRLTAHFLFWSVIMS